MCLNNSYNIWMAQNVLKTEVSEEGKQWTSQTCLLTSLREFWILEFSFGWLSTVGQGSFGPELLYFSLCLVSPQVSWHFIKRYFQNKAAIVADHWLCWLSALCNMLLRLLEGQKMIMCVLAGQEETCLCLASINTALVAGCYRINMLTNSSNKSASFFISPQGVCYYDFNESLCD